MTPDELIDSARQLIQKRYCKEGHHSVVAAALLTKSGKVFTSLNAGTNQPSIATCAEIIAIGMANTDDPHMEIDMIVAVRDRDAYVISPCGKCREYILDYGPTARVIVPADNEQGYSVVPATSLLPNKYTKRTCAC
ncbi:MAG: cytidine deaminase [Alphaproteobacteria bacterium]|nr:cytidine deaminase [Alphaproteobacteria bacterium]